MNNQKIVLIAFAMLFAMVFANNIFAEQMPEEDISINPKQNIDDDSDRVELKNQIEQLEIDNAKLKRQIDDKKERQVLERGLYTVIFLFACWCLWRQIVQRKQLKKK